MTPPVVEELDPRRRRLLFRANHRGTHENDLMIGGFISARIARFTLQEVVELEQILELPEPALADWLCGRAAIPADLDTPMLRALRASVQAGEAAVRP